ncbi:unnamed protein product [Rhizophagus irregularis]|nr:unnamed protein product [Rhizophagus irregularis]
MERRSKVVYESEDKEADNEELRKIRIIRRQKREYGNCRTDQEKLIYLKQFVRKEKEDYVYLRTFTNGPNCSKEEFLFFRKNIY